ncbi:hypothetical protein JCM19037_714 [Geomicrobium sp. JCM 19037]|uniref:thioredoxin domain-containing protein n=1 Tax=Geomicrobium sp. JCM 19037 TaxID=1460634 RepID=UPI00045F2BA3|nr:thioredoxin domain-containing protein [Geomicrobium sp. JCM 19037]GAK02478.1 hypothetical protein JCM19037_714 [Geomicrobium sp. JCM 19037]
MLEEITEAEWRKRNIRYTLIVSPFCLSCQVAETMVEEAFRYVAPKETMYKLNLQLTKTFAYDYNIETVPTLLCKQPEGYTQLTQIRSTANVIQWLSKRGKENRSESASIFIIKSGIKRTDIFGRL